MSVAQAVRRPKREVIYPESDGKPMAETDVHRDVMVYLIESLQAFFRGAVDVYVSGNIFVYYVEGDTRKSVSPDVLVAKGVRKKRRRYYQTWAEGKPPDVVFEITSESTSSEDIVWKKELYEQKLRVPEYFLYDPMDDYLKPRLQGYRLSGSRYHRIREHGGRLLSKELGLLLAPEGEMLRLIDPSTGQRLMTHAELVEELERLRQAD